VKPPAITPKPRVTAMGDDQAIAQIGPVMVIVAKTEPGPSMPAHTAKIVADLRENHAGKGACIVIVRSDVRPPGEQARERIIGAMREWGQGVICGGFVFEGSGFVAAAQRGALTMMLTLARLSYPIKVFGSLREATGFVCGTLGPGSELNAAGLARAIEGMRDAYDRNQLRIDR
jgi:hypothetical protein